MRDPIIDALTAEQEKVAREFFQRPPKMQDVSYEYGYALGVYAGLTRAIERVLKLYRDDKEDQIE